MIDRAMLGQRHSRRCADFIGKCAVYAPLPSWERAARSAG